MGSHYEFSFCYVPISNVFYFMLGQNAKSAESNADKEEGLGIEEGVEIAGEAAERKSVDYSSYKVADLKELCAQQKIEIKRLSKARLVAALVMRDETKEDNVSAESKGTAGDEVEEDVTQQNAKAAESNADKEEGLGITHVSYRNLIICNKGILVHHQP